MKSTRAQITALQTIFTDREAAVEELEFLAETTGHDHAIIDVDGKYKRFNVLPVHDLRSREALVICKSEWLATPRRYEGETR